MGADAEDRDGVRRGPRQAHAPDHCRRCRSRWSKSPARALIDHCLDRFAENGVARAIVNVHWLPDLIEAHLADRARARDRHFRRARAPARPGRRDQEGAAADRARAVLRLQYRRVLDRGAALQSRRGSPKPSTPSEMDAILLVAASAGAVGVDWPGDFTMTREGRLQAREPRHVAPFVYTGVGILKPELFERRRRGRVPPRAVLLSRGRAGAAVRPSPRRVVAACRAARDDRGGRRRDRAIDPLIPRDHFGIGDSQPGLRACGGKHRSSIRS